MTDATSTDHQAVPRAGRRVRAQLSDDRTRLQAWGWRAVAVFFGAIAVTRIEPGEFGNFGLLLGAVAAAPLPLWLLELFSRPPHVALRRVLGQSSASILRASRSVFVRRYLDYLGFVSVAILPFSREFIGGPAVVVTIVALAGSASLLFLALALQFICAMKPAIAPTTMSSPAVNAAGTDRAGVKTEKWQAISGGGAFGPAETTPLLYAPAFALTAAIAVPALCSAVMVPLLAAVRDGSLATDSTAIRGGAYFGAAFVGVAMWGAATRVWRTIDARTSQLLIEQAYSAGFVQSEHRGLPPRYLTFFASDGGTQLLARAWHRRFPASLWASIGICGLAAWGLGTALSPISVGLVAAAIALWSTGRADSLHRRQPNTLAALHFVGGEPTTGLQRLGRGLGIPALAAVSLGVATGHWTTCLAGLFLGLIAAFITPSHGYVWLNRAAPIGLLIALSLDGAKLS